MAGMTFIALTFNVFGVFKVAFPITIALLLASWFSSANSREFQQRLFYGTMMLGVCCLFMAGFSSVKTLLPLMVDALGQPRFFADPFLAVLDRALHLGVDPWVFTHAVTETLGWTDFVHDSALLYGIWWGIPAYFLPAIMVLLGDDGPKQRRYIILFLFSWIVLGNVFAMVGLSGGPIYYDRIFGTEVYAELVASLNAAGLETSWFGRVQEGLWVAYSEKAQAVGSGISAFPSLHVAMITVTALYMGEKNRWLGAIGWVLFASTLFVSVWIGYHYAIDGYFPAIAIVALNAALKRGFLRNLVGSKENEALAQLTTRSPAE